MAGQLSAFLDAAAGRPFAYGSFDCLLFPAEWVRTATGRDPAAAWRGRYRTALGCARVLKRNGGLMALASAGMESVGMAETSGPEAGDVGVLRVVTPGGEGEAGGVCMGPGRWAVLGLSGLLVDGFEVVKAWRVECRRP